MEKVSGIGHAQYVIAWASEEIKSGDVLMVRNGVFLDSYYVNDNGSTLDWVDIFTKKRLENFDLDDIEHIPAERVLSRRRWYIKK